MKLCIVCGINKATVPDRNRGGRLINRVCSGCHAGRLRGDFKRVIDNFEKENGTRKYRGEGIKNEIENEAMSRAVRG